MVCEITKTRDVVPKSNTQCEKQTQSNDKLLVTSVPKYKCHNVYARRDYQIYELK